jgi:two-component system phosphate regulon sensor histidine kinase PhoR
MRIEDQGMGMRPEDQKRVFEKYFRVSTGNRHDVKGFGLGLSYVKLIVEAHGGTIELNSKLGEGTEVEVIMPAANSGATA